MRHEELRLLRQELAIWAVTLMLTVISPVLATAGTFAVYVLIDEGNILTAAKSFSVLLLFSALRFPVNYAGRLLGKAAQALSALQRIEHFLDREIRSTATMDGKSRPKVEEAALDDEQPPLVVTKAAFRVGEDKLNEVSIGDTLRGGSFTVSEFDFVVRRGEILAVCGPVGSGKSTLINGMINEATPLSKETSVSTTGRVAYVPQTPFILNATLRDNILFGLPFDQSHYDRVLDACALRSDIIQLGVAGDLTEIGERGVTLSGGKYSRLQGVSELSLSRSSHQLDYRPKAANESGPGRLLKTRCCIGT